MGMFDWIKKPNKTDETSQRGKTPSDIVASPKIGTFKGSDVLASWRLEELELQKASIKHEPPKPVESQKYGGWPDEASRKAVAFLETDTKNRKGIRIPWHYGDAFGDDFKVVGLRAGGCGVVFFVESTRFGKGRLYAAKTLRKFLESDYLSKATYEQKQIADAFLEEALPWLEMGQHANIVAVHLLQNIIHPETKRNVPFIFSEFMEHGSLSDLISRKGRLDLRETIALGIQVCDGLLLAYEHGGLSAHKDLKPDNIMVYKDGIYKVTDFSSGVAGTPGYMSPEQVAVCMRIKNEHVDHRADQFAIGLILHDAFKGNSEKEQRKRMDYVNSNREKFVNEGFKGLLNSIPTPLKDIVAHCLKPKPENRYNNILSLKDALLRAYGNSYQSSQVEMDDSAEWWFNRGMAFFLIGRFTKAEQPWIEVTKKTQDQGLRAHCLTNLGNVYRATGRYQEALSHIQEAHQILLQLPVTTVFHSLAGNVISMGILYKDLGKYQEAEAIYSYTLSLYKHLPGTERAQASILINHGTLYSTIDRYQEAEKCYEEALKLYRQLAGTEIEQAKCLMGFGIAYEATSRYQEAEKPLEEALKLYKQVPGTEIDQATCLMNMGNVYIGTNEFQEAEKWYEEALNLHRQIPGNELNQAKCLINIGNVYLKSGRNQEAESRFLEALDIYQRFPGNIKEAAYCCFNIGNLHGATGRYQEAEKYYEGALNLYRQLPGTEIEQAKCLMFLGISVYIKTDNYQEAEKCLLNATNLYRQYPGTEKDQANCLMSLGSVYSIANEFDKASEALNSAINICCQYPQGTEVIKNACINIQRASDFKKAESFYKTDQEEKALEVIDRILNYSDEIEDKIDKLSLSIDESAKSTHELYKNIFILRSKCFSALLDNPDKQNRNKINSDVLSMSAVENAELVLRLFPKNTTIMTLASQIFFLTKDIKKAIDLVNKALTLDPDNEVARFCIKKYSLTTDYVMLTEQALFQLNNISQKGHTNQDETEKILKLLLDSIGLCEEQAKAWAGLAWLFAMLNEHEQSVKALQKAQSYDHSEPLVQQLLSEFKKKGFGNKSEMTATISWTTAGGNSQRTGFTPSAIMPPLKILWCCKEINYPTGGIVTDGTTVVCLTLTREMNPEIFGVSFQSGNILWRYAMNGIAMGTPVIAEDYVYIGSADGAVCLELLTGKKIWIQQMKDKSDGLPVASSGCLLSSGKVIISCVDKRIIYNARTGEILMQDLSGTDTYENVGACATDEYVYLPKYKGIEKVSLETGKVEASARTDSKVISGPVIGEGVLLYGTNNSTLEAMDADSLNTLWSLCMDDPENHYYVSSRAAINNGCAFFGGADGNVYAIEIKTGKCLWKYQTGHHIGSSPIITGNILYVQTEAMGLCAFDIERGNLLWRHEAVGKTCSPAVTGKAIVTGADYLYAFATDRD